MMNTNAEQLSGVAEWRRLSGRDRDHLLAARVAVNEEDSLPSQKDVGFYVGATGVSQPAEKTTARALSSLETHGLIERTAPGGVGRAGRGVTVTDAGERALRGARAQLVRVLDGETDE